MKEITLDEMVADVQAREALIAESTETKVMLTLTAAEIIKAAKSGKVQILTDYDADGICSAYIMESTVKSVNPDCEVSVQCNDRRGSYGLSPDVQGDGESRYIVCDMGSNQLPLARERLGENVIIVDHHLIEDEANRKAFIDEPTLCNPHAFHKDDSKNAQYCATGLSYRLFQESLAMCVANEIPFHSDEKQRNTLAVMACIGTATDMVDVLDLNSHNRQILKEGLAVIDSADETNLDFVIGNMLARNGVSESSLTAHQLAFNVGAYLNSASRMSELAGENGAQRMYEALTGKSDDYMTFREMEHFEDQNKERKALISHLTSEQAYKDFISEHRYGDKAQDNIGVYQLPDNVPAAFAGLIAGKLAEATDKAIICVTYSESRGTYTGSGRNPASNETSLISFMEQAFAKEQELFGEQTLEIRYGGHEDAIGISSLNDIVRMTALIDESKDEMKVKPESERVMLKISPAELASDETLAKLQMLEPTGVGLQVPSTIIRGTEQYRDKLFKKNNPNWKDVKIKPDKTAPAVFVTDWSYSPESYPQSGKGGKDIALVAELGISDYKGVHLDLSAKFDRAFFAERQREIAEPQKLVKPSNTINKE